MVTQIQPPLIVFSLSPSLFQSVENCVCILHNLTFQLEKEAPQCFSKFSSSTEQPSGGQKSPTIGCFSPKGSKINREVSSPQLLSHWLSVAQNGWFGFFHYPPLCLHRIVSVTLYLRRRASLKACPGCVTPRPCRCTYLCSAPPRRKLHWRLAAEPCRTSLPTRGW